MATTADTALVLGRYAHGAPVTIAATRSVRGLEVSGLAVRRGDGSVAVGVAVEGTASHPIAADELLAAIRWARIEAEAAPRDTMPVAEPAEELIAALSAEAAADVVCDDCAADAAYYCISALGEDV